MKRRDTKVWKVTIAYVPLPEHMRDWAYNETVRVFLEGETNRKKQKGKKENDKGEI